MYNPHDAFVEEMCKQGPDWKKILPLKPDYIELPEDPHIWQAKTDPYMIAYIESGDFSEYMDNCRKAGLDVDKAEVLYGEITSKFEDR